jgi:U3 small nucleolar RNA-associated protein 20
MFPKMRKRGNKLAGRGAAGSGRAAVLNFLSGLEALELRPLLELLLEPLAPAFAAPEDAAEPPSKRRRLGPEPAARAGGAGGAQEAAAAEELAALDSCRLLPAPWWAQHLGSRGLAWWLAAVDADALAALPLRLRVSRERGAASPARLRR